MLTCEQVTCRGGNRRRRFSERRTSTYGSGVRQSTTYYCTGECIPFLPPIVGAYVANRTTVATKLNREKRAFSPQQNMRRWRRLANAQAGNNSKSVKRRNGKYRREIRKKRRMRKRRDRSGPWLYPRVSPQRCTRQGGDLPLGMRTARIGKIPKLGQVGWRRKGLGESRTIGRQTTVYWKTPYIGLCVPLNGARRRVAKN